jgi:glucose-1-phosphate cytidylyltransferase
MKIYSAYGLNDFIICCGYRGFMIKEYFANYFLRQSDVSFDLAKNRVEIHQNHAEPWRVTVVDTGQETMTGGRLKRVARFLDGEDFCFTYGDGLADINMANLVAFHGAQGTLSTVTSVRPPARFGALELDGRRVRSFKEKPTKGWINGGFFVLSPKVMEYIEGDATTWEREPMERLAQEGQLSSYQHDGFWQPMDTLRDKDLLETMWASGTAPWKRWS